MSTSMSVIYSLSLPPGVTTYSASTLTEALTTVIPTTSVYTTEGRILTTTTPVATVFPAGTTLIFPTPPEPKQKKSNLVVIIAASLGGFIGLVLIGVALILWRRRRSHGTKPRPASPDRRPSVHHFPTTSSIHHSASVTPFGYQSPEHAQPHYDPQLMSQVRRDSQNNVVLAPPPQPLSEKQRRNMLQRQQQRSQQQLTNQPGTMSRSSVDETGSIVSERYTTSSVISSSVAAQGQPQYQQQQQQQQPFTRPGHQHQRSRSTTSTTELMYAPDPRSTSPVSLAGESPQPRLGPSPSYFAGNAGMGQAPGMQVVREEAEVGGPDEYYAQQQIPHDPRQSVVYPHPQQPHPQPQPPQGQYQYQDPAVGGSSGAGSSSQPQAGGSSGGGGVGGASATITRNGVTEVILAKNNTIRVQERNRQDWDVDESMTNPSELPPTYESLRQNRMRRGG